MVPHSHAGLKQNARLRQNSRKPTSVFVEPNFVKEND